MLWGLMGGNEREREREMEGMRRTLNTHPPSTTAALLLFDILCFLEIVCLKTIFVDMVRVHSICNLVIKVVKMIPPTLSWSCYSFWCC